MSTSRFSGESRLLCRFLFLTKSGNCYYFTIVIEDVIYPYVGEGWRKPHFHFSYDTQWVMSMWHTLAFLESTGMRWSVIHSVMTQEERSEIARAFNNPKTDIQVLVVTYTCARIGLNLHSRCHNIVLMESARNVNTELQAIDRMCIMCPPAIRTMNA